jgi:hypothetical protein
VDCPKAALEALAFNAALIDALTLTLVGKRFGFAQCLFEGSLICRPTL